MAIGDIRPQEVQATEEEAPQAIVDQHPASKAWVAVPLTPAVVLCLYR